jgi:MFS family permease
MGEDRGEQFMSALDRATQLQPGSTVRWDRIERAAFAQHQSVLDDERAPRREARPLERVTMFAVALLALGVFLAPVFGVAAVSEGRFTVRRPDYDTMIPVAGVLYSVTFVAVAGLLVRWLVRRPARDGLSAIYSVLTLVFGAPAAGLVARRGAEYSVARWDMWVVPIVAAAVVAAVLATLLAVHAIRRDLRPRGAGEPKPTVTLPAKQQAALERRRQRVAALPEAEREAIRADVDASIANLERRGLITAVEAERARGVELGGLGLLLKRS